MKSWSNKLLDIDRYTLTNDSQKSKGGIKDRARSKIQANFAPKYKDCPISAIRSETLRLTASPHRFKCC